MGMKDWYKLYVIGLDMNKRLKESIKKYIKQKNKKQNEILDKEFNRTREEPKKTGQEK